MARGEDHAGWPGSGPVYAVLVAGAAVLALVEGPRTPLLVGCVLLALAPWGLLLAGRDLPQAAFAVLALAPVVPVVLVVGVGSALFFTTLAAARVASRSDRPAPVVGTTASTAALPFLSLLVPRDEQDLQGAVYFAFGALIGAFIGVCLRRATRLADELQLAQVRLARAAAREERHRIARDVHDLVGHSLTVVVLHVGGARRVLRADPGTAEEALADAERVCRESLDGMRAVVGLLREDGEDSRVFSLDLTELVGGYRSAGLPVLLRTSGAVDSLPLLVRVTLHRVVGEALANAARHGGPAGAVTVDVAVDAAGVVVRVTNACVGAPASGDSGGSGLVGLGERVAALGGAVCSGPEGGTWVLRCRLPVGGSAGRPEPLPAAATPVADGR